MHPLRRAALTSYLLAFNRCQASTPPPLSFLFNPRLPHTGYLDQRPVLLSCSNIRPCVHVSLLYFDVCAPFVSVSLCASVPFVPASIRLCPQIIVSLNACILEYCDACVLKCLRRCLKCLRRCAERLVVSRGASVILPLGSYVPVNL